MWLQDSGKYCSFINLSDIRLMDKHELLKIFLFFFISFSKPYHRGMPAEIREIVADMLYVLV